MASPYSQEILYANDAAATLGSALSNSATTIQLSTGQGALFPNPSLGQGFLLTLTPFGTTTFVPNEVVLVTARTGDTLTVVRGQEGTAAVAWNIGDNAQNWNTAGTMQQFAQFPDVQKQAGNWAVDAGTANAGAITLSPAPASLASVEGAPITVQKVAFQNTGAYTLDINGLGATSVTYLGSALLSGDLPASKFFTVRYDGSVLELVTPPGTARGGPPTGAAGGDLSGTYPNPIVGTNKITNAKLAQAPTKTVKSNLTGGTANDSDNTLLAFAEALGFATAVLANPGSISIPIIVAGVLKVGIIQWFETPTMTYGASYTWDIPTPFPNECLFALSGTQNPGAEGGGNAAGGVQMVSWSADTIEVFCHNFSTSPTSDINGLIIAIGY